MTQKKTTKRTRKSRAKGTKDVTRSVEGVVVVEEVYTPGEMQIGDQDITGFYRFKLEQLQFLKEYSKTCDPKMAGAAVGVPKGTVTNWMKEEKFRSEIEAIHDVWRLNIKMTAETAAASHIKLMNKLNADYDRGDLDQRAKFANPLTKASETYLRAAGHFNHGGNEVEAQVIINIDLGGDETNETKVKISGAKKNDK